MRVTLEYAEKGQDPVRVTANLANLVAWERRYKRKVSDMANAMGIEDLAFLAFEASKTSGVTVPVVFDDFVARLDSLSIVEEEPVNPTHAAPGVTH